MKLSFKRRGDRVMKPVCLPSRRVPPLKVAQMYNRGCEGMGKVAVDCNAI